MLPGAWRDRRRLHCGRAREELRHVKHCWEMTLLYAEADLRRAQQAAASYHGCDDAVVDALTAVCQQLRTRAWWLDEVDHSSPQWQARFDLRRG